MKKLPILFAAVCFLVGASACGGRDPQTEDGKDILRIFMIEGNYLEGTKKDSVWEKIEEETNVSMRFEGAVNNGDYYTRLNPMLNSGKDMPDVFFSCPDSTDHAYWKWANQRTGILYSIDELLLGREDEYPWLSKVIYSEKYSNIRYEGVHTLIPAPAQDSGWAIYYRGDWLVNIGYYDLDENGNKIPKTPETLEEFEDVCIKFGTLDPDGNGVNGDVWAMAPQNSIHCLNPLYHAFGVPVDWDIDADGNVSFMYTDEKFKDFLSWFGGLYERGVIYNQFYTLNESGQNKMFEEGKSGILISNGGENCIWTAQPCEEIFGYGKVICGSAPVGTAELGAEGVGGSSDWGGWWGGFSITKACENPDAALRLFDYLLSPEGGMLKNFGIEGVHYNLVEGKIVANLENRAAEPENTFKSIEDLEGNSVLRGRYRMANLIGGAPIDWETYEKTGEFKNFRDNATLSLRYAPLMDLQDTLRTEYTTNLLNFTDYAATIYKKKLIVQDKSSTYALHAIVGRKNLTSDWTAMMKECDDAGYKETCLAISQAASDAGILDKLKGEQG